MAREPEPLKTLDRATAQALLERAAEAFRLAGDQLGITVQRTRLTWEPTGGKFSIEFAVGQGAPAIEAAERAAFARACYSCGLGPEHYGQPLITPRGPARIVAIKPRSRLPIIMDLADEPGRRIKVSLDWVRNALNQAGAAVAS